MGKYIGKRLLHLVWIMIAISFLTFLLMYLAPGDAATKKLNAQGVAVSQEVLDATRAAMGLDSCQPGVRWFPGRKTRSRRHRALKCPLL